MTPDTDNTLAFTVFTSLREANEARQAEWDPKDDLTDTFRGCEMAGEVGELLEKAVALLIMSSKITGLCNLIKKIDREHIGLVGSRVTLEQVEDEFADAQVCLDLCSMKIGIDLAAATKRKFNKTSEKYGLKTRYI